MKKIIFGLIATFSMAFSANAQDIKTSKSIDLGFNKISTYTGECLGGKGFCASSSTTIFQSNVAYAGLNKMANGTVVVQMTELYRKAIDANLVNGGFVVETDFSLPKELLASIGINAPYWVKAGTYKATYSNQIYTFTF